MTYPVPVTELCSGLAVNYVDPSCPFTTDRDIKEVIRRGLAHNSFVRDAGLGVDPSCSVPWEADCYGSRVGSLALWLWGDKLGCLFALRSLLP